MKLLSRKILYIIFFSGLFALLGHAQQSNSSIGNKRKALEQQRKELVKKIQETKKVLEETRNKKTKTLADLKLIARQIENREKVIATVANEIRIIEEQILEQQAVISALRDDVTRLKQDYGKSIAGAYKQRNVYDKVLFIFSAETFNQALKRIEYLNQLGDYRKHQAELILHTQNQIINELNELIAHKREKQNLVVLKAEEKKGLEEDKKEEGVVLIKLQDREKELRRILAQNERAARKLNEAIADLIQKEIAAARKREMAARNTKTTPDKTKPSKTTTNTEIYLTPEALKLSNDFESNRSSLPWPVEKGLIAEKFGTHAHATLKGVMVNNNGVDIRTQAGVPVRAVFKGTVRSIFSIPGMGKIVLINHGKYYTAYAKLANVNVAEGQTVATKENIGDALTNDEGETEVHFEIWKAQQKQNPEDWLKN
jgi:murein hydrolase activator